MTRLTTKLTIAAAALFAAGAASAQTMKADIPFDFRAGGKVMTAGIYYVELHNLGDTVVFRSRHNGAVMALPITHKEGAESDAKLVFSCVRGTCSIAQVWPGNSRSARVFSTPKRDPREQASLATIPLRTNAE